MGAIANICPDNVIFCSAKAIADKTFLDSSCINFVPLGMLRVQAAGKIQAIFQVRKVRLISEYIWYIFGKQ